MNLLTIGAVVASAVVIGSLIMPALADHGNDAEALTAATDATARKADDLSDSFGAVVPDRVETAVRPDSAHHSEPRLETQPPGHVARYDDDDMDHAVAAALRELAALDPEVGGVNGDERVIAIENLRDVWAPRYQQAAEEHRRLAYRIEHADRAAGRYFDTQAELTRQISNHEDRLRAEQGDRAEREIYRRWREQAVRTMAQADRIMVDLRDMDIRITKQMLSANFASVYHDFQEVPAAIGDLHQDLAQFRARSEEISATFGGN